MVALVPPVGALRDAFLAAGLGFLLGLCYRTLRFALGDSKLACFVCDVTLCAAAAVFYRAAAVGSFAAGIMRWYTLAALLTGYTLCQKIFARFFLRAAHGVRFFLLWPFRTVHHRLIQPVWHAFRCAQKARREKQAQKRAAKRKKSKRDLPNGQQMLYNSQ